MLPPQMVDDLTGDLPGGCKDTPGEIRRLRCTVLLTQLAGRTDSILPSAPSHNVTQRIDVLLSLC